MPFHIRPLTNTDLPAYKALRDEALLRAPEAFTSDYESGKDRPADVYASRLGATDSGHFALGAFAGLPGSSASSPEQNSTQLLGSIALERDDRIKKRHSGHVVGMMVWPDVQGQGVATQLVAHCIGHALTSAHLEQLVLTVTASNAHVVRLYERAGFVAYGLLPRAIKVGAMYYDKLHMQLDLRALRPAA
jgi:RimJ/RimL family protein N-acetyltransferase